MFFLFFISWGERERAEGEKESTPLKTLESLVPNIFLSFPIAFATAPRLTVDYGEKFLRQQILRQKYDACDSFPLILFLVFDCPNFADRQQLPPTNLNGFGPSTTEILVQ